MRSLSWFIAVVLFLPVTLFAQRPSSSGSSSGSSAGSSSSSSGGSYSPPSSSSSSGPSYSPPSSSSSGGSRSYDSGSRSSDSGSRSSSSSSSSGGGSYNPPSRSNSSEPNSRGSNTGSSNSPSYHSGSTNNSSGYSGGNSSNSVRDLRNGAQPSTKQFTVTDPSREPRSGATRSNERLSLRETVAPIRGQGEAYLVRNLPSNTSAAKPDIDPKILSKYAPKESKLLEKQSRLDEKSHNLFVKYKLAGRDAEYAQKQAKLDQKRNKLLDKEQKLAQSFKAEVALRKPKLCNGDPCPVACPPGTASAKGGCVSSNPTPPPTTTSTVTCGIGSHSYSGQCVSESSLYFNSNCEAYLSRMLNQKKILESLQNSAQSACAANAVSMECTNLKEQVNEAENNYLQLEQQYRVCQASNTNVIVNGRHP